MFLQFAVCPKGGMRFLRLVAVCPKGGMSFVRQFAVCPKRDVRSLYLSLSLSLAMLQLMSTCYPPVVEFAHKQSKASKQPAT